ncbi:MAG: hypothetical protein HYS13_02565 [Planctomycetia bacterium]|nr:hypothetical protein [Planctomycetia bacterium]
MQIRVGTVIAALLMAALACAGCGSADSPQGVTVTGTLVRDDKPIEINPEQGGPMLMLDLYEDANPVQVVTSGEYNKDGTFKFEGAKAGKMRIVIRYENRREDLPGLMTGGAGAGAAPGGAPGGAPPDMNAQLDRYKGTFSVEKTEVKIDVPAGGGDVGKIDIGPYLKKAGL